jgi:hypothetical protein
MKALLTLAVIVAVFGQVYANDTIPIINTIFHGVNTLFNITRPAQVVVTQPTVVPAQPVVVTQPALVTPVTSTPQIYYVNGQAMNIQNGVYVQYVVPYGPRYVRPPAPPKHHNRHPPPGGDRGRGHRR